MKRLTLIQILISTMLSGSSCMDQRTSNEIMVQVRTYIIISAICIGVMMLMTSLICIANIRRQLADKESENRVLRKQFDELMMEREEL